MRAEKRPLRLITIALFAVFINEFIGGVLGIHSGADKISFSCFFLFPTACWINGQKARANFTSVMYSSCFFFTLYFELPSAIPGIEPWKGHLKDGSVR